MAPGPRIQLPGRHIDAGAASRFAPHARSPHPASLTMRSTVANPSPYPLPASLVVKKGSNNRARVSASIPPAVVFHRQRDGGRCFPARLTGKFRGRVINRMVPPCASARARSAPVQTATCPQLRRIGHHQSGAGIERNRQFDLLAGQPPQQVLRGSPQFR